MSSEVKVVSFFTFALAGLIVLNTLRNDEPVGSPMVQVLETEVREVKDPIDIESVSSGLVKPILYTKVTGLPSLPPFEDKARFVDIILPAILVAKYQIEEDRLRLKRLSKAEQWSLADSAFLKQLTNIYKTDNLRLLNRRLITHPNSIVLAQAAVESGWGKSRFFKEANNLFGIWSYNTEEPRIIASMSRIGQQVYLRKYGNISESIVDYFQTIGRARPYGAFRRKREQTNDVYELLPLLSQYSERREEYILQIKAMIKFNEFEQYDNYTIDPSYFISKPIKE